ncbi:MAG: hypothetical protein ACAI38_19865 [Myxococcota bacterium]
MYSQPVPSSARSDYTTPSSRQAASGEPTIVKRTVVATLDGSIHQGPPPPWGYITWGQRLARNVALGTLAGLVAAYATDVGIAIPALMLAGAACSLADRRP